MSIPILFLSPSTRKGGVGSMRIGRAFTLALLSTLAFLPLWGIGCQTQMAVFLLCSIFLDSSLTSLERSFIYKPAQRYPFLFTLVSGLLHALLCFGLGLCVFSTRFESLLVCLLTLALHLVSHPLREWDLAEISDRRSFLFLSGEYFVIFLLSVFVENSHESILFGGYLAVLLTLVGARVTLTLSHAKRDGTHPSRWILYLGALGAVVLSALTARLGIGVFASLLGYVGKGIIAVLRAIFARRGNTESEVADSTASSGLVGNAEDSSGIVWILLIFAFLLLWIVIHYRSEILTLVLDRIECLLAKLRSCLQRKALIEEYEEGEYTDTIHYTESEEVFGRKAQHVGINPRRVWRKNYRYYQSLPKDSVERYRYGVALFLRAVAIQRGEDFSPSLTPYEHIPLCIEYEASEDILASYANLRYGAIKPSSACCAKLDMTLAQIRSKIAKRLPPRAKEGALES